MRACRKCNAEKPLTEEFFRPHGHAPGFRWTCRECERTERKTAYAENPEPFCAASRKYNELHRQERNEAKKANRRANPEREKAVRRKWLYGISEQEYKTLFEAQAGRCAICNKDTKLCVDHCHKTGKVRGLLCKFCNSYLGNIEESEAALVRAIQFIQR